MSTPTHETRRRRSEPVLNTFRSLIQILSAKIELADQYDDYQAKAHADKMPDCANLFEEFSIEERKQIDRLIALLQHHLWCVHGYRGHRNGE
jgi:hypothetical protein